MSFSLHLSGLSDVGRLRRRNEDAFAVLDAPPLLVVADGMGGHPAGDVASALAVEAVRQVLADGSELPAGADGAPLEDSPTALGRRMLEAVGLAERTITEESERNPERRGMGTTLTALVVRADDGRWAIGHVGDSRAYRWADGRLKQLTRDHTWVQEQVERGAIPPEEAHGHPWGHILAQALGTGASRPQLLEGRARPGDVYLLCTDGLTTMLPDVAMERILENALDGGLEAATRALVEAANDRGGVDNITVAMARVGSPGDDGGAAAAC